MFRKRCITAYFLILLFLFAPFADAHTYRISVLVDTDMALDDIRAIAMLLNSDMADIPLIVSSDGAASPEAGCRNLGILLKYLKRKGTKIAIGELLGKPAPPWRAWSENLKWPEARAGAAELPACSPAAETIVDTLNSSDKSVLYLCLGPLTNLADALKLNAKIKDKISRVVYYGGHPDDSSPGWNTSRDPDSARFVFDSGLKIYSMILPKERLLHFDQELYKQIGGLNTAAARLVSSIHRTPQVRKLLLEEHFFVWDELPVIFLNQPSLFKFSPSAGHNHVMTLAAFESKDVRNTYIKLLGYSRDFHLSARHSVVLKAFPDEPALFKNDISPQVRKIIGKYGLEEWKACFLTNELHGHLGIYSLIGAKMGIRAREILEAPFDTLEVISLAGNSPPLSCMNDGLQVSTGASLGRGAIKISDGSPQPAGIFIYKNEKLTLRIKKELLNRIRTDIKAALKEHGGLNAEYFAHIRKLSIDYWVELDRREIFDEFRGAVDSGASLNTIE
jgi:pyrimidine-specific ribonucleoside hydrolase